MNTPIYLQITNNTDQPQAVSLFNAVGSSGALTPSDSWDLSSELANAAAYNSNVLVFILSYNGHNYKLYTYTSPTTFSSATQVAQALNTFNIGIFTSTGNNVQTPLNGNYVFSSISLTNFYPSLLSPNVQYNYFGALVYDNGWQSNGVGNFTRINPSVPFWINPLMNLTDGAMNRESIWNNVIPIPFQQQVGFTFSYYSQNGGQVYLGLSGDDIPSVYLNNSLVLQFDIAAMGLNIASILGPSYNDGRQAFSFWHMFPLAMVPGWNLFQIQNYNNVLNGGLGVEIYNNTAAQLLSSTSYAGLNLLFKSNSIVGQNLF